MFKIGDVIDGKYLVKELCSDDGGMGTILHVELTVNTSSDAIVLKYCKESNQECMDRFCREVKYLDRFSGNTKVLQVLDSNLFFTPPYFVMSYYKDGDLSKYSPEIKKDIEYQELIFNKMIDCVSELHAVEIQHRDIKPQNFLVENDDIIISDLGLAKEVGAGSTFTKSHAFWGTEVYLPPEFRHKGFKDATPASDIFMLGKSFYFLLTGRDPYYMTSLDINPAIYHVIERCCDVDPMNRYQKTSELKQDLKLAYDVIQGRANGIGEGLQLLFQIISRLDANHDYVVKDVESFLDLCAKLPIEEKSNILREIPNNLYQVISQDPFISRLKCFLDQYAEFIEGAVATWSYAEIVADNMKIIFMMSNNIEHRTHALDIAIHAAILANRFAAMDTCKEMICMIHEDALASSVAALISKYRGSFLEGIEPTKCQNDNIKKALYVCKGSGK